VTIREATVADLPAIRAIAHATWPVVYQDIISSGQIKYMLDLMYGIGTLKAQFDKGHQFFLALDNSTANGFSGCEVHFNGTSATRLHKLYVLPSAHGRGVGGALLAEVEMLARKAYDAAIELNVNRFNPALDFYRRKGFIVQRDEILDIGQGYVMDDHVMVKQL
jgi:diamine N-acetyltransferase